MYVSPYEISSGLQNCAAEDNAVLTMLKDADLGSNKLYAIFSTCTIDLNGKHITGSNTTSILNRSNVTICDSIGTGSIQAINCSDSDLRLENVTIISGDSTPLSVSVGDVVITGGSIDSTQAIVNRGTLRLELAEGTETGTSFPSGIAIIGSALKDILGEGLAFWQDGRMIALTDNQTSIAGPVTVGKVCDHSGNENTDDGDCTTAFTCSVCGVTIAQAKENHVYGNDHICAEDACNAEEPVYVAFYSLSLKGNIAVNYYFHIDESAQDEDELPIVPA